MFRRFITAFLAEWWASPLGELIRPFEVTRED